MKNQIIQGDCIEVMKKMPDKSVDLILTDPPYGINLEYDNYKDTEDNWFRLFEKIIPEFKRISTMSILPCCRIKVLPWIYNNFPPDWLICWYKGSPGHRSFVGFNDWEPLLVYGKNQGVQMHDYFYCQPDTTKEIQKEHPCPKSIEWARWLISRTTKENDLVLDPFAGSGTTCVAAKRLKRNFIGIDISEKYCEIARQRLRQEILI